MYSRTVFILVEPAVPENVGAAARAIKTMGFHELRLVNSSVHLRDEARWLAHASNEILEQAAEFNNLADALADIDYSVATTAKKRTTGFEVIEAAGLPDLLHAKGRSVQSLAVVFGREERGLDNTEIDLCDLVSAVPLAAAYPSLNLGQAVMLYAYILADGRRRLQQCKPPDTDPVTAGAARVLNDRAAVLLKDLPLEPAVAGRISERLQLLGEKDTRLALSFLQALEKKRA